MGDEGIEKCSLGDFGIVGRRDKGQSKSGCRDAHILLGPLSRSVWFSLLLGPYYNLF